MPEAWRAPYREDKDEHDEIGLSNPVEAGLLRRGG